jgi:hypothetical protein
MTRIIYDAEHRQTEDKLVVNALDLFESTQQQLRVNSK